MKIEGDTKLISAAFVKARKAMGGTVAKDAQGNFGKYATLAAIVEATTDVLADNGLAVVQEASTDEAGLVVETWIVHESGALMQFSPLTLPLTDRRPQAVGSAITYARRYALAAICGLAPDDDDGQAAQDAQNGAGRTQAQRPAQHTNGTQKSAPRPTTPAKQDAGPTDEEHDILSQWSSPTEAQSWAIMLGACSNEFEARNSFKHVVDEHGGKLTKENINTVYVEWIRKVQGKLQQAQAA